MKIAVIGTGYVGLVSGACFAKMGNDVICIDIDEDKIKSLQNNNVQIYEPGLKEIVCEYQKNGNLRFSCDIKLALNFADVLFIAVGTPMGGNGQADLKYVLEVAKSIGQFISKPLVIVDKSTVPVGTAQMVREVIETELRNRAINIEFEVVSNPEFLKEGAAVEDFLKPDRVIIGARSEFGFATLRELYSPFMKNHNRLIEMDIQSAEMTKYAANSMLATKISFINEIAAICEKVGADINMVRKGIGSDSRIGYSFIYPGCGYGGSCFPKDIEALIFSAEENGIEPLVLKAVEARNERQKRLVFDKISDYFSGDLKGKRVAIWGLAFKPNTDDLREASSLIIINLLLKAGAKVVAYDPKAMDAAKKVLNGVEFALNRYEVLNGADCLALVTEWSEFRSPDFLEIKKRLKNPVIFDGRNQYDRKLLFKLGFTYFEIGVKSRKD